MSPCADAEDGSLNAMRDMFRKVSDLVLSLNGEPTFRIGSRATPLLSSAALLVFGVGEDASLGGLP
jgi:hypothetical protein